MIRNLENGTRLIELGLGTTTISLVHNEGETESGMICFSNQPLVDGKLQGDEVLIHIANGKGVFAYFRAVVDMLRTWKLDGTDEEVMLVKNQLELLQETLETKIKQTDTE